MNSQYGLIYFIWWFPKNYDIISGNLIIKLNYSLLTNSLYLNPITLNSENTETCNVIFPGWGDTHTIEYLQTNGFRFFNYFGRLVNSLLQNKFFVKNFTLRGAPYDFRRLPCKCLSNRRFILIHSEYCTLSYEIKLQTGDVYYHNWIVHLLKCWDIIK